MPVIGLEEVRARPIASEKALIDLDCVEAADCIEVSDRIVFRVVLRPHDVSGMCIAQGYPIETVNIVITADQDPVAIPQPIGIKRDWKHRNFSVTPIGDLQYKELCLWYKDDRPGLRWSWDIGLHEYVRIVSRHLIYEERNRRTGSWPVEDAPHGYPDDGTIWPIKTPAMWKASKGKKRG